MSAATAKPTATTPIDFEDSLFESHEMINDKMIEPRKNDTDAATHTSAAAAVSSSEVTTNHHHQEKEVASPFQIHSSVLDSVFSTNLDGKDALLDHTPMFDELDFIMDGAKVNSKEDWVALFGGDGSDDGGAATTAATAATAAMFPTDEKGGDVVGEFGPIISLEDGAVVHNDEDSIVPHDEVLEALLFEPSPNGLSDDTISAATTSASSPDLTSTVATSVGNGVGGGAAAAAASTTSHKRPFGEVESRHHGHHQSQLFTPNPSSTLPTPQLDMKRTHHSSSSSSSSSSKRAKVDHLGCVTYSKKQRSQTLEPITFEGIEDSAALKRAKNTEAARRSRARKMERMTQLEDRVEELMGENSKLVDEVERLKALLGSHGIAH
ncbi:GCN4 [Candida theae]|uniref:GCN4 n=1 Tax=Candida theae TaxID=1198502 RepID=A0AAD5BC50_9ASCO|nr:GCN4 [Candida theae]KAI5952110.1 GCN4 [Candida theae]